MRKEHFYYKAEHDGKTVYLYMWMDIPTEVNTDALSKHIRNLVEFESGVKADALISVTKEEYMNNRDSWFVI